MRYNPTPKEGDCLRHKMWVRELSRVAYVHKDDCRFCVLENKAREKEIEQRALNMDMGILRLTDGMVVSKVKQRKGKGKHMIMTRRHSWPMMETIWDATVRKYGGYCRRDDKPIRKLCSEDDCIDLNHYTLAITTDKEYKRVMQSIRKWMTAEWEFKVVDRVTKLMGLSKKFFRIGKCVESESNPHELAVKQVMGDKYMSPNEGNRMSIDFACYACGKRYYIRAEDDPTKTQTEDAPNDVICPDCWDEEDAC